MLKTKAPPPTLSSQPPRHRGYWRWFLIVVGVLLVIDLANTLLAEAFWFQELQYLQVFSVRILTRVGLGAIAFVASLGLLWSNLVLAEQLAWPRPVASLSDGTKPISPTLSNPNPILAKSALAMPTTVPDPQSRDSQFRPFGSMRLWQLLPLTFGLGVAIGFFLIYHSEIAISHWHPQLSLYQLPANVPVRFQPESFLNIYNSLYQVPLTLGLLMAFSVALLIYPRWLLRATAVLMSIGFGLVMSEQWTRILLFFNPTLFDQVDPLFHRDIGFYVFQFPTWELLAFWLVGLFGLALLSVGLTYLLSGDSLSQGRFPGFSAFQIRHLYGIGGCLMLAVSLSYWLDRYNLLFSTTGVIYGASYTNVAAELPAYTVLSGLALALGLGLLGRSLIPVIHAMMHHRRLERSPRQLNPRAVLLGLGLYVAIAVLSGLVLPVLVQRLIVQPNELIRELPFIQHTIALTRNAFALDEIDVETFDPEIDLTAEDLEDNIQTINNIRLWDTRPLLETNRQLQRIRLYYEFPDADVDRYDLVDDNGESDRRQVLISARELDYDSLPDQAKTWVNEHLIYTHGYGFTMSPVNTAGPGGLPDYFIRGIEMIASSDTIRRSIPIGYPRIYYGELTDTYVMTQTQVRELDYPSGSENEYNSYDGSGGIGIGPYWKRLMYARYLGDWRMLLTADFRSDTRLLFRRNIRDRVQAIAPFLRFDNDPYLVVADITSPTAQPDPEAVDAAGINPGVYRLQQGLSETPPNYLYWVIDAYTTTQSYPYSDPLGNDFNYIRNSVKVVVDAYNGTTAFYVVDESDPIIRSWNRIFPNMFLPLEQMPLTLQDHIRYPQDYFQVQSDQLMTYHMTDPQVFYNREDEWRAPSEIYADEQQVVEPYFLIMNLPTGEFDEEEFILLRPFTPAQRRNMIAWLAARSDGRFYGTQLLYTFPKQELVFGPEQVEARINQDPAISQQISLWNREGSRAVQGNLLVIPIERSLLYVEPLYLQAELNQLPTLVRVIVVFENQIAMAPTLEQALDAIFGPDQGAQTDQTPTILRSVDELSVPALEVPGTLGTPEGEGAAPDEPGAAPPELPIPAEE